MFMGVSPISPNALLLLLQQQLQQGGVIPNSNLKGAGLGDRAFLTLWPDDLLMQIPPASQFLAIRPSRFPIWQSVITGAGTPLDGTGQPTVPGFSPVVSLIAFSQIDADPEGRSVQAITQQTLGIVSWITNTIIPAVQFWLPTDPTDPAGESTYLREPARITDAGFGLNPRKAGNDWWTLAPIDLELKFTSAFSG